MSLGGLLVGRGLVTVDDIDAALERQRVQGGRLGDNLIALGLLTAEELLSVIHSTPPIPTAISETGIPQRSLLNLLLKFMHLWSPKAMRLLGSENSTCPPRFAMTRTPTLVSRPIPASAYSSRPSIR